LKPIDLQEYRRKRLLEERPWRRDIEGVDGDSPLGALVQRFAWLSRNDIDISEYELYLEAMEKDDSDRKR